MRAFVLALVLALGTMTAVALTPATVRADDFHSSKAATVQPVFWRGRGGWGDRYWGGYRGYYGYPGYYSGYYSSPYYYPGYGTYYYNPGGYYGYYWGY